MPSNLAALRSYPATEILFKTVGIRKVHALWAALLLCPMFGCEPAAPNAPAASRRSTPSESKSSSTAPSSAAQLPAAQPPGSQALGSQPPGSQSAGGQSAGTQSPSANTATGRSAASPSAADKLSEALASANLIPNAGRELESMTQDNVGGDPWLKTTELPYEYWEAQYLNAAPIGATHYRIERIDSERFLLTAKTTLQVQRAGQTVRQSVSVQTIEQADGEVDSYFEETEGSGTSSKTVGSITDGNLPLKTTTGQTASVAAVHWPEGTWGPMGVHQLLHRRPMHSGERRRTRVFLPQIHKVALVALVAGEEEDTTSPDGPLNKLLPVDVVMQLEDQGITSRMWVDSQGVVQKSVVTAGLNISSYRVSREAAERLESQGLIDVFSATAIKINPPLVDPEQAQRIAYVVESKSKDPYGLLSRQANQSVRSETAFRSSLTVVRPLVDGPIPQAAGQAGPLQTPPTPECSESSVLIKSDDPAVAKLATVLAGDEADVPALALKLTEGVFKSIRKKTFSRAFDSAQDVARTLEGDCTEHAVLLTALLRNRGIPARIASGLMATTSPEGSVFAYHMWTEAWLGDRWLPLDATIGNVAGCGHIKFLESPLSESNPYSALLPVLSSLGQLTISVADVTR